MLYGRQNVNGATYYFNNRTGALDMRRSASLPSDYVPSVAGISERTFDWGNTILFVFLAIVSLLVWALRTHILARRVSYFVLKGMFILNRLIRQIPQ